MTNEANPKMGFEGRSAQAQASLGEDLWDLHAATAKLTEFTAGRTLADFEGSALLRELTRSLLGLIAASAGRIASQSPEIVARLFSGVQPGAALEELHRLAGDIAAGDDAAEKARWFYVQDALPALFGNAATELEAWHEG